MNDDEREVELAKIQLQRDQMRSDLFKWFVMAVIGLLTPFLNITLGIVQHMAIDTVAEKTDLAAQKASIAAKKAAVVEAETRDIKRVAVENYAMNAEWRAEHTGDPDDMAKANSAKAAAEASGKTPP